MKPADPEHECHILIVEDDAGLRELLVTETEEAGYPTRAVGSAEAAQAALAEHKTDLIITDIRLPGADGMALLDATRRLDPAPSVIVITAFGSVPQAVAAVRAGATDFLTKPLDLERLRLAIERASHIRRLERELDDLHELLGDRQHLGLIGNSPPMRHLLEQIRQIARSQAPVLVTGESGVGKELVARAVARCSSRHARDFVAVNCASIPEALLESEFFGHHAGAFTGADRPRQGLFMAADGGTLLLDEIGELSLSMQAKLLRVLQEGRVRPVGSDREMTVDVRIIAATNKDLTAEVAAGRFREDLYYRLETFTLAVPPLRDRGDDIELLALHFLRLFAHQQQSSAQDISPEALTLLRHYSFPGNVRELSNLMERAATFCRDETVTVAELPPRLHRQAAGSQQDAQSDIPRELLGDGMLPTLEELQHRYVRLVLDRVEGNKRRAAALLGIGRRTLYRWLDADTASDSTQT